MRREIIAVIAGLFLAFCILDYFAASYARKNEAELERFSALSSEYIALKAKQKNGEDSKKALEELSSDVSKVYFSASVSKKDLSSSNMTLNLLILNGDELDAITKRVLNSNLKITKLWIEDAQIGYLFSLEVAP